MMHGLRKRTTAKSGSNKQGQISSTLIMILPGFILFAFFYVMQDGMIFYNVNDPQSREFLQNRPGFYEIAFTAGNNKNYHGMMYRAAKEKSPLVIYFGGNGECSYRHMRNIEAQNLWPYYAGFNYLYVDYDGYGFNDGRTNFRNMYEGALAAYDYAVTLPNVDPERIVAMGFSLGTGSAVYLAANRPVAGLILAAPYANGYDLYNNVLPIFYGPMKLLVRQKLPSDEYAPKVTSPVLIIASRNDEIIPFSSSEQLSKLFSGGVDFIELLNVYHNDIFRAEGVLNRVQYFLEGVASD